MTRPAGAPPKRGRTAPGASSGTRSTAFTAIITDAGTTCLGVDALGELTDVSMK